MYTISNIFRNNVLHERRIIERDKTVKFHYNNYDFCHDYYVNNLKIVNYYNMYNELIASNIYNDRNKFITYMEKYGYKYIKDELDDKGYDNLYQYGIMRKRCYYINELYYYIGYVNSSFNVYI